MAFACRQYSYWIALTFLSIFCFHLLKAEEEKLFCPFDGKDWKIGFQEYSSEQSLVEMIPQQEDILNWKELFTVQKFDGIDLPAEDFAASLKKAFKEHLSEQQDLILKDFEPNNLSIFESSFVLKKNRQTESDIANSEYNLGRVLKGQTALYYIRYSAKDEQVFEKNKQAWAERFKQAYLAETPRSDQQGQWLTFTNKGVYQGENELSYEASEQTIYHPQAGYSLSLPKNWLVEETDIQETEFDNKYAYEVSLLFSDPLHDIYGGIAFLKKTADTPNLKAALRKRYASIYREKSPQSKLISKGKLHTVLGEEGLYLMLTEKDEVGWIAFFETSQTAFRLEIWGPKNEIDSLKTSFDKLVSTLRIFENPSKEDKKAQDLMPADK